MMLFVLHNLNLFWDIIFKNLRVTFIFNLLMDALFEKEHLVFLLSIDIVNSIVKSFSKMVSTRVSFIWNNVCYSEIYASFTVQLNYLPKLVSKCNENWSVPDTLYDTFLFSALICVVKWKLFEPYEFTLSWYSNISLLLEVFDHEDPKLLKWIDWNRIISTLLRAVLTDNLLY